MSNQPNRNRQRLLIFISVYVIYSTLNSVHNGADGKVPRLLSEKSTLELVHISHTGGAEIEAIASTQASINWGACHFIQKGSCMDPDMTWYNNTSSTDHPNEQTSYSYHNIWLTPPSILAEATNDPNYNPYINKELFTIVRNPYAKMVSEFYCFSDGYNKNRDKTDKDDPAALNAWITEELKKFFDQTFAFQQLGKDSKLTTQTYPKASFPQLFEKRFTPQFLYVYNDGGKRVIDSVIHFENIKSEFNALMKKYDIDMKVPSQIKESSGELTHLDLYPETISLINSFFQADFEAFGYQIVESFSERTAYSLRARSKPCTEYEYGDVDCRREEEPKTEGTKTETIKTPVPIQLPHSTTFMLGILTEMTEEGARARDRIRKTYLLNTENSDSICSWETYKNQFDSSGGRLVPCLVPYAFIVGGNPDRPLEHVDDEPIVMERNLLTGASLSDETDIIHLNIREDTSSESMREKSFAYFKWASTFGPEYHLDFVSAVQTGSLLVTEKLLEFIDKELPPYPISRRIYGGETYGHMGGYYATDPFYFMSIDLAEYISKIKLKNMSSHSETAALDIGKLVTFNKKPVQFINMNANLFWYKDLNDQNTWDEHWQFKMKNLPRNEPFLETFQICQDFVNKKLFS
jgi:hypothetical protein